MNRGRAGLAALALTATGALGGAVPASAAWRETVPNVFWGSSSCKDNTVQVRRAKGTVDVVWGEFFVNCTARANLRLEFYGPGGYKRIIDGYAAPGRTSTVSAFGAYKPGYWSACASFRNNNWTAVSGTRTCATELK